MRIIYCTLFLGIIVVSLVVIIQRFYKNLLGDEGYLMFTLPVKTWKLVMSKLLVAIFWILLSAVIGWGSILMNATRDNLNDLGELFKSFLNYFGTDGCILILLLVLAALVFSIIHMYTAIALGHLLKKHKLLASFGMYVAINTLVQMVFILIMYLFWNTTLYRLFFSSVPTAAQINMLILFGCVFFAVFAAAGYIATNVILKRRLNLE